MLSTKVSLSTTCTKQQILCTAYERQQDQALARLSASTFCFFLPPPRRVLISVTINTKILGRHGCGCCCSFLPDVFCTDSACSVILSCAHLSTRNRTLLQQALAFCMQLMSDWFLCCNYNRFDIAETSGKELFFSLFPLYVTCMRTHTVADLETVGRHFSSRGSSEWEC